MERNKLKIIGPYLPWSADVRRGVLVGKDGREEPVLIRVLRAVPAEPQAMAALQKRAKRLARARNEGMLRLLHVSALGHHAALVYEGAGCASVERILETQRARQSLLPLRIGLDVAAALARCIAWGLDDVARREPGHRLAHAGITPTDVLIDTQGRVLLAGLEVLAEDEPAPEPEFGPYLAPEGNLGPEAMVFALGAIWLLLLTHQTPSDHPDPHRRAEALAGAIDRVNQRPGEPVPPSVVQLLRLCLSVEPAARPPALALATQLEQLARALGGPGVVAWAPAGLPRVLGRRRDEEPSAAFPTMQPEAPEPLRGPLYTAPDPSRAAARGLADQRVDPAALAPVDEESTVLDSANPGPPPLDEHMPTTGPDPMLGLEVTDATVPLIGPVGAAEVSEEVELPIETEAAQDPWIPPEAPNPLRAGSTFFATSLNEEPPIEAAEEPPMASPPSAPPPRPTPRPAPTAASKAAAPRGGPRVALLLALVALVSVLGGLGALGVMWLFFLRTPAEPPPEDLAPAVVETPPEPAVEAPEPEPEPAEPAPPKPAPTPPSRVKIAPPKETVVVPPEPPKEEPPAVAPFIATFVTGQEGTLLSVSCHRGQAIGSGATIIVRGAEPGPCKISGKTKEGGKLVTSVVLEGPVTLTCFAGGEEACR